MPTPTSLPLSNIFPVTVVVSPTVPAGPIFNQALIVGSSAVISSTMQRVEEFSSTSAMLQAGFTTAEPEYLAASIYFEQVPPPSVLWIGRQDLTAIAQVTAVSANLGTGYVVGDVLTVVQSGASAGLVTVTNITAGGDIAYESTTASASSGSTTITVASATGITAGMTVTGSGLAAQTTVVSVVSTTVTISQATTAVLSTTPVVFSGLAVVIGSQGTGYSVANGLTTTGGTGSGAEVDIIAIGETPLQAVTACRAVQSAWYCCMFVATAQDSDHVAIANFIQGATPLSTYFVTTSEASALAGSTTSLPGLLQAQNFSRTLCVYSTTQSGTYPNNIYASAAPMGLAMGLNTGAPGSYFALAYKTITGVGAEPLSQTQVNNLVGSVTRTTLGLNCNVIVNFQNGAYADLFYLGLMSSGAFFDQIINLDQLASNIQISVMNYFVQALAVPITDSSMAQVKNVIGRACNQAQVSGFIASTGTWTGVNIGTGAGAILNGQSLSNGYATYSEPVANLTSGQRSTRQLPPVTVALIESESGNSLSIEIYVQQ